MNRKERINNIIIISFIIFLAVALLDSWARGEPYLIYNPTINIMKYEIEINGEIKEVSANVVNENSMQLVYDLVDVPIGASAIRARAQFEHWGWCQWSEPYTVIRPGPLENPMIVTNPPLPLQSIEPADSIR